MTATRKRTKVYSPFRCARCERRLKRDRYVRSKFTGAKFCFPGEGCCK